MTTADILFRASLETLILGGAAGLLLALIPRRVAPSEGDTAPTGRPAGRLLALASAALSLALCGLALSAKEGFVVAAPAGPFGVGSWAALTATSLGTAVYALVLLLSVLTLAATWGTTDADGACPRAALARLGLVAWSLAAGGVILASVEPRGPMFVGAWLLLSALPLAAAAPLPGRSRWGKAVRAMAPLLIGDACVLAGVAYPAGGWAGPLLVVGALAKAGMFPFHGWQRALIAGGRPAALPAVLACRASGVLLLVRQLVGSPALGFLGGDWLLLAGMIVMAGPAVAAWRRRDPAAFAALQGSSRLGYMLLGLGSGTAVGVMGGLLLAIMGMVHDTLLILGVQGAQRAAGERRPAGLREGMPLTYAGCVMGASAASGLPPLCGFAGQWLVLIGVASSGSVLTVAALCAAGLTSGALAAMAWGALRSLFGGPQRRDVAMGTTPFLFATGLLVGLCVVGGLGAGTVMKSLFGVDLYLELRGRLELTQIASALKMWPPLAVPAAWKTGLLIVLSIGAGAAFGARLSGREPVDSCRR